jgi:hypothetical protein
MKEEIPQPLVILQPIGKGQQPFPKSGPQYQQYDGGPDGYNIETNLQQTEEFSEPERSPLGRLRIESDCQGDDLEYQQRKQSRPPDIDKPGPRANDSIIEGETMQSKISPARGDANFRPTVNPDGSRLGRFSPNMMLAGELFGH